MLNFNNENKSQENRLFDDTLENNYPEIQKINDSIVKIFKRFIDFFKGIDINQLLNFIQLVKITTLIEEQLEKNNNYELPLLLESVLLIKSRLKECVFVKFNTVRERPDLKHYFAGIFDEFDQFMEHIKTIQEKIEKKQDEFKEFIDNVKKMHEEYEKEKKEKIINKRVCLFSSNSKDHSEIENSRYSDFMENKYGTDNDEELLRNGKVKSKLSASTGDLGTSQIMSGIESVTEKRSCFLFEKSEFLPVASDELPHLGLTDSNKKETLKSSDFKKNESYIEDQVLFDNEHIPEKAKSELFSPTGDRAWLSGTPTPSPTKQHCQQRCENEKSQSSVTRLLGF